MPTPISTDVAQGQVHSLQVTLNNLQPGDLIVIAVATFATQYLQQYTCSFNTGIVPGSVLPSSPYPGVWEGSGFGYVTGFWAVCASTGSVTATITRTDAALDSYRTLVAAAAYRGVPTQFDQPAFRASVQPYPAASSLQTGVLTAGFNVADSFVVTMAYVANFAPVTPTSLTGDTEDISCPHGPSPVDEEVWLFSRTATGPSIQTTHIQYDSTNANFAGLPIFSLVFSKPLPRPPILPKFFMVKPGAGFQESGEPREGGGPPGCPTNRPLIGTLPYRPLIGDFVVVFVSQAIYLTGALTVQDAYGNTYTEIFTTVAGSVNHRVFRTILTALPAAGQIFQILLTSPMPLIGTGPYQATSMAVGVYTVPNPTSYIAAVLLSTTFPSGTEVRYDSAVVPNVPAGTLLIAGAAMSPIGGTVAWSALDSYALQRSYGFCATPVEQANAVRLGAVAIMDKTAATLGPYDARITATGNVGQGSIILLAVSVPAAPNEPKGPCEAAALTAQPLTDQYFELRRLYVSMKPAPRLPVRGS